MAYSFFSNAPMVTGKGSISYLAEIHARRAALVIDPKALSIDHRLEQVKDLLTGEGANVRVIAQLEREPHVSDVMTWINPLRDFQPDVILAVGGGAVIDLAKALWVFYEHPDLSWETAFQPFAIPPLGQKARLIAVPTTSGTGSETTIVAVLVDQGNRKRLILSWELIPNLAILDPLLPLSMPKTVAINTGMDALSHALEATIRRTTSALVVTIAKAAAIEILQSLPLSVLAATNTVEWENSRERMHYAASLAGIAINNSGVGLTHAMDQIGPLLGIPHGLTCGILLPHAVKLCCPNPDYADISMMLGYRGSEEDLCNALVERLWDLGRELEMPAGFRNLATGSREIFEESLDSLVQEAMNNIGAKLAPVELREDLIREAFRKAFNGQRPG